MFGEITVSLPELITIIIAVGVAVGGTIKLVLGQFERRLEGRMDDQIDVWQTLSNNMTTHAESTNSELRHLEKDIAAIKLDLANYYVRRDDWIRLSSTIDAKIDAIARLVFEARKEARDRE